MIYVFKKKQQNRKKKIQPFGSVAKTERLREYCGSLKSTPFSKHILFCERITEQQREALLDQGFLPVFQGSRATHILFCVAFLHSFPNNPRLLFNSLLDLNFITGNPILSDRIIQDTIAIKITESLASHMQNLKDSRFLIRCNYKNEFPHCVKDEVFDQYWLIEIGVHYRAELKRLGLDTGIDK